MERVSRKNRTMLWSLLLVAVSLALFTVVYVAFLK